MDSMKLKVMLVALTVGGASGCVSQDAPLDKVDPPVVIVVPDEGAEAGETNGESTSVPVAEEPEEVPMPEQESVPVIAARSSAVVFRQVPPVDDLTRDKFWQIVEVQNIGNETLSISDMLISPPSSAFSMSFPGSGDAEADPALDSSDFPDRLEPGGRFPVRIYFNPTDELPASAELIIASNDPQQPNYVIDLVGNSGSPCLQLSDESELNFGEGTIGEVNRQMVVAENCSRSRELTLGAMSICTFVDGVCEGGEPTFSVDASAFPIVLEPSETTSFAVEFSPEDTGITEGELTVRSDDPARSALVVPVIGKGTTNACPRAVAEGQLPDEASWRSTLAAAPLQTVQLRATGSDDPDGEIARYEWTILSRPPGSTARLMPGADVPEPTMFLDLAGEYEVELRVYDDEGLANCGASAIVSVEVVPDSDLHVQLVWDTPTDTDQTDTNGTDLDLHFLHPDGYWNDAPYDIFWGNTTADWGSPGSADDPLLEIDDVDGAGPESVTLPNPESGRTYAVGAYYYADHGFGPSYATVRIFVNGQRVFERRDQYLPSMGTFWYAATISWPDATVFDVSQVQSGFPSRP